VIKKGQIGQNINQFFKKNKRNPIEKEVFQSGARFNA
jgi:hypothetical protein